MNSLYIGLGGAGISSVAELAKRMRESRHERNNRYLYIDTYEYSKEKINSEDIFIQLGGNSTMDMIVCQAQHYAEEMNDGIYGQNCRHLLKWLFPGNRIGHSLNRGAESNRQAARVMLWKDYNVIKQRLYQIINSNNGINNVHVVSGTCGGTGGGIVLDILYMLYEIQNEHFVVFPVNLHLIMPGSYTNYLEPYDIRYTRFRLNAYALIDEINACLKDYWSNKTDDERGMQWNKYRCCENGMPPFHFEVFNNAFLFDSIDSIGNPMSNKEIAENVTNFLYVLESGARGWSPLLEVTENMIQQEKYNSQNLSFIKGFTTTGMFIAQTWEELTRKYVHDKFIQQMLLWGFVGSEAKLPQELLMHDSAIFENNLQSLRSQVEEEHIRGLLATILSEDKFMGRKGYKNMVVIMDFLKQEVVNEEKKSAVEKLIVYVDDKGIVEELAHVINHLLQEVRDLTYTSCSEWTRKYNLQHARQLVEHLNAFYEQKWKQTKTLMMEFNPKYSLFNLTKHGREDLTFLFEEYINYLVYRNLSNENGGYLRYCEYRLEKAIYDINLPDYEINGVKFNDLETYYIKYLFSLKNDETRVIFPSLDYLVDSCTINWVAGNKVEKDYAQLVWQAGNTNSPDMTFDLDNDHLLYTYKQKILNEITHGEWEQLFDMTDEYRFADNIKKAFYIYAKHVEKAAKMLSLDDSLKMPFSELDLSIEDLNALEQMLINFTHVNFFQVDSMNHKSSMSIYLGDFVKNSQLQHALEYNHSLAQQIVQSDIMSDRIVKLHMEFGYSFDDYRYFEIYKQFSENYLHTDSMYHLPYVDKRFLTERKPGETLADMFERKVTA